MTFTGQGLLLQLIIHGTYVTFTVLLFKAIILATEYNYLHQVGTYLHR